jgi:lauroyl/myristoyl acyltransferase
MQPERTNLQEKVVKRKKSEEIHKKDAVFHRYSGLKSNQTYWFCPDSAHSHAQAFICFFSKGKASL